MASKTPIVFFIILTVLVLCVGSYLLMQEDKVEGFQILPSLVINTCPTFASEIQTAKGSTDCCEGDMIDGKCNGATFCTKSPAYPGVPTCVDKWREYFQKKGSDLCPASMLNYYEDITKPNAPKGCSASVVAKDGKAPSNRNSAQCRIYASENDNRTKGDSCYVERMRLKIQCPVVNGRSPNPTAQVNKATNTFEYYFCQYPFELNIPDRCFEKVSLQTYMDKINPNWRTNPILSLSLQDKSCENYIQRRESARIEAERLQRERAAREAAERARREEEERRRRAEEDARRREQEANRLRQQLEEATRRQAGNIQFAWYGGGYRTRGKDVTQQVRNARNAGSISVNNNTFGDPAPGVFKRLYVDFVSQGNTRRVEVGEGGTLSFLG